MNKLPLNQILHGDCTDVMGEFPDQSVDLVFADPPYNLQLQQALWRPDLSKVDAVDDAWDRFENLLDYDEFTVGWLIEARRVLKDTGTLWVIGSYHNIYRVGKVMMDLGFWILNDIVWIKTNPMPNFHGVRFTNAHETILWAQKTPGQKYTFNYHQMKAMNDDLQMRSDWVLPICTGAERLRIDGEKVHSTQKPEALLHRVIASSTNPGDIILDPFFGTGTTGAVAKKLHRHWVGIERDPLYITAAAQRIAAVQPAPLDNNLFRFENKRKRKRIPFGLLLEHGLLSVGQLLYFGEKGNPIATILANSKLKIDDEIGSIHQLAHKFKKGPCNGWEHWYYFDEESNRHVVIDALRDRVRMMMDIHPH